MKISLLTIGIPVCVILLVSIVAFARGKTVWRFLQLIGAVCLLMMVLTHIAEAFHLIPWMHWGESDSPGHYLDLSSAIVGLIFLPLGYWLHLLSHRSRGAHSGGN